MKARFGSTHRWRRGPIDRKPEGLRARAPQTSAAESRLPWSAALRQSLAAKLIQSEYKLLEAAARIGMLDPASFAAVLAAGWAPSLCTAQWLGASLFSGLESSLPFAAGFELGAAKVVDYQLSTRLRAKSGTMTPFFAAMTRAGLEAGFSRSKRSIPWWYPGISYGATGGMDCLLGQMIGGQLRNTLEEVLSRTALSSEVRQALIEELRDPVFAALGEALGSIETGRMRSPLARHLALAANGEHDAKALTWIEEHLMTSDPGNATAGTLAGRAISGAVIGALTAHPFLGAMIGMLDASIDAVLTGRAEHGRARTLAKLKAQLLHEGWNGRESGTAFQTATDFYAQIGREFRDLGRDLRSIAKVRTNNLQEVASALAPVEAQLFDQLEAVGPDLDPIARVRIENLGSMLFEGIGRALEREARVGLDETLTADFPELRASAESGARELRAMVLAGAIESATPGPSRPWRRMIAPEAIVGE